MADERLDMLSMSLSILLAAAVAHVLYMFAIYLPGERTDLWFLFSVGIIALTLIFCFASSSCIYIFPNNHLLSVQLYAANFILHRMIISFTKLYVTLWFCIVTNGGLLPLLNTHKLEEIL